MASDESMQYALVSKWRSFSGGSIEPDKVHALATDAHTNAYFCGLLGTAPLENQDGIPTQDLLSFSSIGCAYVSKTDKDGGLQWASTLDYGLGGTAYGLFYTNNTVFVAGTINNEADAFDSEGNYIGTYGWSDAILSSVIATNGGLNWSRELSLVAGVNYFNSQSAYKAVVASGGYLYAVGFTTISGLSTLSTYKGGKDAIVVKYEENGDFVWARYLGGVNDDEANAITVGQGGLYISGTTQSPGPWITLGDYALPSAANRCGFLTKLDVNGSVVYTTVLGGEANDDILAMRAVTNVIYLAGTTYSANFCSAYRLNQRGGSKDGFVLMVTDVGAAIHTNWFRYVGTNALDAVYAIDVMDADRLVVCGSTDKGGWMPAQDETSSPYVGGVEGFMLQMSLQTGDPLWSTYVGDSSNDVVYAVAAKGSSLFLGGTTGSMYWEMFGGFLDAWSPFRKDFLYSETGFVGRWALEPGLPPLFTNDIADVTVHEGESIEFVVGAQSKPSAKYLWFTNGVPAGVAPTNRYVIDYALPGHSGVSVQCIASNFFATTAGNIAHITVIPNGFLNVSLSPPLAVEQGAAWQLTGGVWRLSGTVPLYPGTYDIAFTNLLGYTPLAAQTVTIESSKTTSVVVAYVAPLATAVRTVLSWTNVSLSVNCPGVVTNWTLVETLPVNSSPVNYGSGTWNATDRTLTYSGNASSTVGYTTLLGAVGDYDVSGSITSMPISVATPVTGDTRLSRGNFLRKISGTNVWIYMAQPTTVRQWSVDENLSETTLQAFNISNNGDFVDGWIFWGETSLGTGRVLSYSVAGTPGSTNFLSGSASLYRPTVLYTIYGDNAVIIPMPAPVIPPPTILSFSVNGATGSLTFTSVVNQAYMVLTNANLAVTNGWKICVPAVGENVMTTVSVPVISTQLFYRVKSE